MWEKLNFYTEWLRIRIGAGIVRIPTGSSKGLVKAKLKAACWMADIYK